MYPTGSRIGYSLVPRAPTFGSLGLRFTSTILDHVFIAKYTGQLSHVAFWVRYNVGIPQRSAITLTLYQDGGSISNPGTVIESISGGSGTISEGRLVFSGFTANLVKGRRYRLRLTTSNSVDTNFPELLLGPSPYCGDFNDSPFCSDFWQVRWQGADANYGSNTQVFQIVSGQPVSRDVLIRDVSSGIMSHYNTHLSSPIGVRFTAPPGKDLRYLGLVVNHISMGDGGAFNSYWQVLHQGTLVGSTSVHAGFNSSMVPVSDPWWGLWLYRFTEPLVLEGGKTYDFIFSIAGQHNSSAYAAIYTVNIDSTYVPQWLQRYRLLVSGNEVSDRVLPTFMLIVDDAEPLPGGAGIINPYVSLPVG